MFPARRPRVTQPRLGATPVARMRAPGGLYGLGSVAPFGGSISPSTQPLTEGSGIGGYALIGDGVYQTGSIATSNSPVSTAYFSIVAVVEFAGAGTKGAIVDRDINTRRSFQLARTTGSQIEVTRFNTAVSSVVTATTVGTVPDGVPTVVVLVVRGLDFTVYLGKETAKNSITGTPQIWDGVLGLCATWGGTSGTSGYPASNKLNGKLYAYDGLPFALSDGEAQAIAQSPAAAYSRLFGYRRIWVPVSSGGAAATIFRRTLSNRIGARNV